MIDQEVSKLVEKAYKRAVKLISDNKEAVEDLAKKLLEKEVIFREDLEVIFGERPYEQERKRMEKEAEEEMKRLRANVKKLPSNEKAKLKVKVTKAEKDRDKEDNPEKSDKKEKKSDLNSVTEDKKNS